MYSCVVDDSTHDNHAASGHEEQSATAEAVDGQGGANRHDQAEDSVAAIEL